MTGEWEAVAGKESADEPGSLDSSWPGLSRPSTSFFPVIAKNVDARDKPGHDEGETGERGGESSVLQELACLVQRAERQPCFRERLGGTFLAIDHGEDQRDIAAGLAYGFHRLHRRAACRGDVLDDDDALALQAFALGEPFHRKPRAVLLRLLAHEERCNRMALDPGELGDGAGQWDRAHL